MQIPYYIKRLSMVFQCNDDNKKIIFVEYDTSTLNKIDQWLLCKKCNTKPEYQKNRLIESVNRVTEPV